MLPTTTELLPVPGLALAARVTHMGSYSASESFDLAESSRGASCCTVGGISGLLLLIDKLCVYHRAGVQHPHVVYTSPQVNASSNCGGGATGRRPCSTDEEPGPWRNQEVYSKTKFALSPKL